jgi:hypothetical protein
MAGNVAHGPAAPPRHTGHPGRAVFGVLNFQFFLKSEQNMTQVKP